MCNTDELFDMLSIENSKEIQQKGTELAKSIKSLCVFIRPITPVHGKDIWENCAEILCGKTDKELSHGKIIDGLFEWLDNLSLPGAALIEERLHRFEPKSTADHFKAALEKAVLTGDGRWSGHLAEFAKDDLGLFELLSPEYQQLVMNILTEPEKDHRSHLIDLQKEQAAKKNEKAIRDMENYIEKVGDILNEEQRQFLRNLVQGEDK